MGTENKGISYSVWPISSVLKKKAGSHEAFPKDDIY